MGRRKKRYSSSSDESESDSSSSDDSSDDSSDESDSDISSSDSDDSSSESESEESSSESESDDDDDYDEDPQKTRQDIKEIIRDSRLMKFERAIIEDAGINSLARMRDCTERQLKRTGMEYSERDRLLKAFRTHLDERREKKKGAKKKGGKRSKKGGSGKRSKSKGSSRRKKEEDDPLSKLDTGWSGKKQAWKDYKDHEARVAELVEFYEEIGRKKTNGEEHARKLLLSYPGGIGKLAIALDKKYHHIPYGWETILEEAQRKEKLDGGDSDSD